MSLFIYDNDQEVAENMAIFVRRVLGENATVRTVTDQEMVIEMCEAGIRRESPQFGSRIQRDGPFEGLIAPRLLVGEMSARIIAYYGAWCFLHSLTGSTLPSQQQWSDFDKRLLHDFNPEPDVLEQIANNKEPITTYTDRPWLARALLAFRVYHPQPVAP